MQHFGGSILATDEDPAVRERGLVRITVSVLVRVADMDEAINRITEATS